MNFWKIEEMDIKIVRKQIQLLWRGVDGQGMCTKIVSAFYFFPNLYPISH